MTDNPRKAAIWAGDMSPSAGKPYRPCNGSEGRMFEAMWCVGCQRDAGYDALTGNGEGCPILANALCFDLGDEGYPTEWRHDAAGVPECTAWEPLSSLEQQK